jgi:hypothetical protein
MTALCECRRRQSIDPHIGNPAEPTNVIVSLSLFLSLSLSVSLSLCLSLSLSLSLPICGGGRRLLCTWQNNDKERANKMHENDNSDTSTVTTTLGMVRFSLL